MIIGCSLFSPPTAERINDPDYNPSILNNLDGLADAMLSSPIAPDIVSKGNTSRSFSRNVAPEDQDLGIFSDLRIVANNYNGVVEARVDTVMDGWSPEDNYESVNYPGLTKKWLVNNGYDHYYQNDDASISTYLSTPEMDGIWFQYDAFSVAADAEYEYSRVIYYYGSPDDNIEVNGSYGCEIIEVWEYPDRKEVSNIWLFDGNDGTGGYGGYGGHGYGQFLAVTDTSTVLEKTSLLKDYISTGNPDFYLPHTFQDYDAIGYIDFSMTTAEQVLAETEEYMVYMDDPDDEPYIGELNIPFTGDEIAAGFPEYSLLQALHNKAIRQEQIGKMYETIEWASGVPYTGFF